MEPRYRKTLFDRLGPDAGLIVKVAVLSPPVFIFAFLLAMKAVGDRVGVVGAFFVALAATALVAAGILKLSSAAASGFGSFVQPSGRSTPYEQQFSRQEALAARGDVAGALASYEEIIAADPAAVEPRVRAAELYAGKGGNPARAAELFRQVQRIPGVTPQRDLYASNRLVDLYRGPLGDEGRALVELRRLAERFPTSREAAYAREAIASMKRSIRDS